METKEKQEMTDVLNRKVGKTEQPKGTIAPAKVKIVSVVMKDKDKNGVKMSTTLAQFMVKHPDKDELIVLSKVKYVEGDKVWTKGFWVQTDEKGNFYKGSSIDIILKKLGCETLADCYGKEIETETESETSPYLCLKAY